MYGGVVCVEGVKPGNHYLRSFLNSVDTTLGKECVCACMDTIGPTEHTQTKQQKLMEPLKYKQPRFLFSL